MTNSTYVLVQKTVSKVTDETTNEELLVSDDIVDILNELMNNLEIHKSWGDGIEMTDAKSFVSETFDRTYIYSIHFKKNPEVMRFKEEEESSTHCETCKNYESSSDITGWCSACPGTVIKDMNANNTCAAYEAAICEVAHADDIGDVSDGFHTFNQLYHQRAMLFAALVNQNRDISWKSRKHEDGEPCFGGGWFVVTIDTPAGPYGYHYEDKYWDLFNCKELERAKHWDGYIEKDVGRLMSLYKDENCETEPNCFNCRWCNTYTKWCCFSDESIDGRTNACAMWECDPYEKEE